MPVASPHYAVERRFPRMSATIPVSLMLVRENSSAEFDAYTVDVSHQGVRVRTNFALYPGDMIGIAPTTDTEPTVTSRVVWTQRSALGGSLAGLEFVNPLSV